MTMPAEMTNIVLMIVNIFMIPAISLLIDSKINGRPLVFSFRNIIFYFFYTAVVFAASKVIAHLFNLILHSRIDMNTVPYTFIAIFVSILVPVVIKLLVTRFDFNIVIKANDEK